MKAITLTQPWATLVAIGAKKIETRSWKTSYRGPLAIRDAGGPMPVGVPPAGGALSTVNYCGLSGGKDSTATALWCIHESGYDPASIRFTFCNTHNESPLTYEYLKQLSERFQAWGCAPVLWLEPERGFLELAKWKGRFPSRKVRFCTQFLKVIPTRNDVHALLLGGSEVVVHSGVRRAESPDRANLQPREMDAFGFGCETFRPILDWTTERVFAFLADHGVEPNPLYRYGARRVGCFPCINSRKSEIAAIAKHFPERISAIRKDEKSLGSTFFCRTVVPPRFRSLTVGTKKGPPVKVPTIDDVVAWANTGKGAVVRSAELFPILDDDDAGLSCQSGMGMCE